MHGDEDVLEHVFEVFGPNTEPREGTPHEGAVLPIKLDNIGHGWDLASMAHRWPFGERRVHVLS